MNQATSLFPFKENYKLCKLISLKFSIAAQMLLTKEIIHCYLNNVGVVMIIITRKVKKKRRKERKRKKTSRFSPVSAPRDPCHSRIHFCSFPTNTM